MISRCHAVTIWFVVASAVNCAGAEYLLRVEEVDGRRPQIEQTDGTSSTDYGWLPVADVDSEPIRIGRHIEILVSTSAEFHLRFSDGGELIELKGKLFSGKAYPSTFRRRFGACERRRRNRLRKNERPVDQKTEDGSVVARPVCICEPLAVRPRAMCVAPGRNASRLTVTYPQEERGKTTRQR